MSSASGWMSRGASASRRPMSRSSDGVHGGGSWLRRQIFRSGFSSGYSKLRGNAARPPGDLHAGGDHADDDAEQATQSTAKHHEITPLWEEVVCQVIAQGLALGIQADPPKYYQCDAPYRSSRRRHALIDIEDVVPLFHQHTRVGPSPYGTGFKHPFLRPSLREESRSSMSHKRTFVETPLQEATLLDFPLC